MGLKSQLPENPNIFANNPLDRASYRRADPVWIAEQLRHPDSLVVPVWRLNPFVLPEESPGQGKDVGWMRASLIPEIAGSDALVVFLGINRRGKSLFTVDVSHLKDPENSPHFKNLGSFEELRGLAMSGDITPTELAILAQAKSMIDWHRRHGFCASCGTKTEISEAGYKRVCGACKAEHFPRTDPVVIMLATYGDKCFLGRQKIWPKGMHSALAGFVETGESIEEAVARELHEEAGLTVNRVTYHSTQPWPFPSSLMIGCLAEAVSEDFTIDGIELSEGRWFSRAELALIMSGKGDGTAWVPPPYAIAHQLIRAFVEHKA